MPLDRLEEIQARLAAVTSDPQIPGQKKKQEDPLLAGPDRLAEILGKLQDATTDVVRDPRSGELRKKEELRQAQEERDRVARQQTSGVRMQPAQARPRPAKILSTDGVFETPERLEPEVPHAPGPERNPGTARGLYEGTMRLPSTLTGGAKAVLDWTSLPRVIPPLDLETPYRGAKKIQPRERFPSEQPTLSEQVAQNVPQLGAVILASLAGGPAGGLAVAGAAEGGAAYEEALSSGANRDEAQRAALVTLTVNGLLEMLPVGRLLRQAGKPATGVMKNVLGQAVSEGVTETFQEASAVLAALAIYQGETGLSWEEVQSLATPETLERMGTAGFIGAILGGGAGGLTAGSLTAPTEEMVTRGQQALSQIEQNLPIIEQVLANQAEKKPGAGVGVGEAAESEGGRMERPEQGGEPKEVGGPTPVEESSTGGIDDAERAGRIAQALPAAIQDVAQKAATGELTEVEAESRLLSLKRAVQRITDDPLRELAQRSEEIGSGKSEAPTPEAGIRSALETLGIEPSKAAPAEADSVVVGDRDVPIRWAIVEADTLQPSHVDVGGELRPNPEYDPDLQPRDRSRKSSRLQVAEMAQNLDPRRLGRSVGAYEGAPIVGLDNQVESGNARLLAIKQAYEEGGDKSALYRRMVAEEGQAVGAMTGQFDQMKKPVLVRLRQGSVSPQERQELARQMNEPPVARMAPAEQARADAERLSVEALELLNPTQQGDITVANSGESIRSWLGTLPATESAAMLDPNGQLNTEGERRLRSAVLAKALGDPEAVGRLVESPDSSVRNLGRALVVSAPGIAQVRAAMDEGVRDKNLDVAPALAETINELDSLRRQGRNVTDELAQQTIGGERHSPEVELLLRIAGGDKRAQQTYGVEGIHRSSVRLGRLLNRYVELVDAVGDPRQASLASGKPQNLVSVLETALRTMDTQGALPGTSVAASVGETDPDLISDEAARSLPLATPELVAMVQDVSGGEIPIQVVRSIRAARGQALGSFAPGKGIKIRADKIRPATLAHEIGHWVGSMPEGTLKRGNILGHVAALQRYMKGFLAQRMGDSPLSEKERSRLSREATREARESGGNRDELYAQKLESAGMVSQKGVTDELWALSQKWRPLPKNPSKQFLEYRRRPSELYADAFSVLVNNPRLLAQEAPTFAQLWESYLNARPAVAEAWTDYQALVAGGPEAVVDSRTDRVLRMVERGDALRQQSLQRTQGDNGQTFAQALVDGMVDRNSPLYRRVAKARKEGASLDPEKNPVYWVEELPYFVSEASAYLAQGQRAVLDPLRAAEIDPAEFGALLGLRRAAGERAELWNPLGLSGKDAEQVYQNLEKRLGPEKAATAQAAAEQFWSLRRSTVIEKLRKLELLDPGLQAKIESNAGYVRYEVQRFIREAEGRGGGGVGMGALREQIGTIQEIGNPLVETMLTDLALIRVAHRNAYARHLVEFEQAYRPDEITEAKRGAGGRFQNAPRGQGLVTYLHEGKTKGFYMPTELAETVDRMDPENKLYNFWMKWAQNPFRTLVIERSIPFALFNLPRDFQSVYAKIIRGGPVSSAVQMLKYFAKAAPHAYRAAIKEELPPLEVEMLEAREIAPPGERFYAAGEKSEPAAIDALLSGYGLLSANPGRAAKYWRVVEKWLDRSPFSKRPGAMTERWAKMAAKMYLKDHQEELGLSDKEISHEVRDHGGTPDFYRRGKWFRFYNSVMPFSNVAKEGWRSDLEVGLDPKTRAQYWQKRALWVLGPKLAMVAAIAGLMGEPLKRLFARIPEHDLRNYMIVPWGFTKEGKASYTRIPYDHFGQFLSNLFWTSFQSDDNPEALASLALESLPYTPAGIHPYLEIGLATSQYVSGRNPYDTYHGRTVVNPWVWNPEGPWSPEAIEQMTKWSWNTAGGRLLVDFQPEDLKEQGTLEKVLQYPVLGPIASRLLKVSDYGLYEEAQKRLKGEQAEGSRKSRARREIIEQNLLADDPLTIAELHAQMRKLGIHYKSARTLKTRSEKVQQQLEGGLESLKSSASKDELKIIEALEKEMEAP